MAKIHFNIVHGFLEKEDSNWANLSDFSKKLLAWYPGSTCKSHEQKDYDDVPFLSDAEEFDFGNSWGGSAIFRRADKNPSKLLRGACVLDPVTNPFDEPKQDKSKEWTRRHNIGHTLCFTEVASILKGNPLKPENLQYFTGQRDDANRFTAFFYGYGDCYVLDEDPKIPDFMEHFKILGPDHPWVEQTIKLWLDRQIAKFA